MKRLLFLWIAALALLTQAQDIRPVRDDIGFCWQPPQMERLLDLLTDRRPRMARPQGWWPAFPP